jgi:hypothetical protein
MCYSKRDLQHMLETGHTYSTVEGTMEILQIKMKGHLHNSLEQKVSPDE